MNNKFQRLNEKYLRVNKNKIFTIFINIKEVLLNNKVIRGAYLIIREIDLVVLLEWSTHIKLIQIRIDKEQKQLVIVQKKVIRDCLRK